MSQALQDLPTADLSNPIVPPHPLARPSRCSCHFSHLSASLAAMPFLPPGLCTCCSLCLGSSVIYSRPVTCIPVPREAVPYLPAVTLNQLLFLAFTTASLFPVILFHWCTCECTACPCPVKAGASPIRESLLVPRRDLPKITQAGSGERCVWLRAALTPDRVPTTWCLLGLGWVRGGSPIRTAKPEDRMPPRLVQAGLRKAEQSKWILLLSHVTDEAGEAGK